MSLYAIEHTNGTALYAEIAKVLERDYVGQSAPGDKLPSEGNWLIALASIVTRCAGLWMN
ncbi:MAG TPA: hypothetical protein PLD80_06625 [Rugosibacter sp.]|nr:hypothetical protein [Rugosibacter sp.]